jgi:tRNA(fMet)-specific endonuclease VapC
MFLFDTEHISIIQRRSQPAFTNISARISVYSPDQFFVSIVSFQEGIQGWQAQLSHARNSSDIIYAYSRLHRVLSDYSQAQILDFDVAAANRFDVLRKKLRIGTLDLRIACIALVHGYTVLTRNVRDFRQVPGLLVEDWTL